MNTTSLRALAGFLPIFEAPDFTAGEWIEPGETSPGVVQMPFAHYGAEVIKFIKAAYKHKWVRTDFSWSEWAQTDEAARLRDDENAIEGATADQLARLLTVVIRQDRFADGALLSAFKSGLITRIVRRATDLARSTS